MRDRVPRTASMSRSKNGPLDDRDLDLADSRRLDAVQWVCNERPSCLRSDRERMLAHYAFRKPHWKHVRTTNIVESNFDPVRLRTDVCKRLRSGTSATYLVYALLVRHTERRRKFNGYQHVESVHQEISPRRLASKRARTEVSHRRSELSSIGSCPLGEFEACMPGAPRDTVEGRFPAAGNPLVTSWL
jgi:mutator family transposase